MLKYQLGEWKTFRDSNLDNLIMEHLKDLDNKFRNAIYLIDPFQFFCRIKSTGSEKEKLFYMLTPNKKGTIIYNNDFSWNHLQSIYNVDKVNLFEIKDLNKASFILKLKDGEIINICSNGKEAVIYRD